MKIPIWSVINQDDIYWYECKDGEIRREGNDWVLDIDIDKYHKGNTGKYNIHVYMLDSRDVQTCHGTTYDVVLPPKETETEFNADKTKCTVTVSNLSHKLTSYRFVIIDSATGEQKSYVATKISGSYYDCVYRATVDVKPNKNYRLEVWAKDGQVDHCYYLIDFSS